MKKLIIKIIAIVIVIISCYMCVNCHIASKLYEAIEKNDIYAFERYLESPLLQLSINITPWGLASDSVDVKPQFLLHCAAYESQPEMMSSLIENGADVNRRDKYSCTALHYILRTMDNNDYICAKILFDNGFTISENNGEEYSYTASLQRPYYDDGLYDEKLSVDSLKTYKLIVSNMNNHTQEMKMEELCNAVSNNNFLIVKYMLDNYNEININERITENGWTIVGCLNIGDCDDQTIKIAELLIEKGADPHIENDAGETILDEIKGEPFSEELVMLKSVLSSNISK